MSVQACETLRSWGSALVVVRRWSKGASRAEVELVLRMRGVGIAARDRPVLQFERESAWRFPSNATFEVTADAVTALEPEGAVTRVGRLRLPESLASAVHVGQWTTRDLDLKSITATPGWNGRTPRPRAAKALVIWTDFGARSRLTLWWACATQPRANPIAVAPMPRREADLDEICFHRSPGELIDAAPGLRVLTRQQVSRFAANWNDWCSGRPPRAVALPNWPTESAWVGLVPTPIWDLFARSQEGALGLSIFDQLILEHVGPDWSTPLDTYVRMVRQSVPTWGDLTIASRIAAWGRWRGGRFVERRRAKGERPMTRWEYRLTSAGLSLRHQMTKLDDAPPLKMGGFSFYSPRSWVLADGAPVRWRQ